MVSRKEWYDRVNAAWPDSPPPLTADEAVRAGRKLYRFVTRKTWTGRVRATSGRRRSWVRYQTIVVNPDQGWGDMIHDLSHDLFYRMHPDRKPHDKAHAKLELRMRKEALRRGWLNGSLKPEEKPRPDQRQQRYQRTLQAIERWESKLKRAENALRKLVARKRYYDRNMQKA